MTIAQKCSWRKRMDAFAANYGGNGGNVNWSEQETHLLEFFAAAHAIDIKVFISFDTTAVSDPTMIVNLHNQYANNPAMLYIDGKPMLSSFQLSDNKPIWNNMLQNLNTQPFFMPCTLNPDKAVLENTPYEGIFVWLFPWKLPTDIFHIDITFAQARTSSGKKWMVTVAPWYFKRFDANQNWAHQTDDKIYIQRLQELLVHKPDFIQLATWNDWGESSYLGTADTTSLCPSCYWATLEHSAFLQIAQHFIAAYKADQTSVTENPGQENVYLFCRTQPSQYLDPNDPSVLPLPLDSEYLKDKVFLVGVLTAET